MSLHLMLIVNCVLSFVVQHQLPSLMFFPLFSFILVGFHCKRVNAWCEHLLANKKYLPKGVFMDKQYCEEIENTRRILRPVIRKARTGKYKGRCRMERDQIVIDGKRYGLRNLHQLPPDLNTFKCTSEESEDCVGFFGELNELSNFHPCKFKINGIKYSVRPSTSKTT